MSTVKFILYGHKRNREFAEKLGLVYQNKTLSSCAIRQIFQALGTNAFIHKAIRSPFEWHGNLIFDEKWLETPERILKLRRYGITEENIFTLCDMCDKDLTDNLDDLELFGFSEDQIKKYLYMIHKEKDKEDSDSIEVSSSVLDSEQELQKKSHALLKFQEVLSKNQTISSS